MYADDTVVALANYPSDLNLLRVLSNGATFPDLWAQLPPSGDTLLKKLVLHVAASGAFVPWGTGTRPVALRDDPSDDGATLTLTFADGGTSVNQGQHLIVIGDNRLNRNPSDELFACPDGELTCPAEVSVRNACDWPEVNCSASVGSGAVCDTSPVNDAPYGDQDGCRHGHLLPLGARGALLCSADTPASKLSPVVQELEVTLAAATVYFRDGSETSVDVSLAPFDLRAVLANGLAIPELLAPAPPAPGVNVVGVRLHLQSAAAARIPDASQSTGWRTVIPRSGAEDSGLEIDLTYPEGGVDLVAGSPIRAKVVNAQASDWDATWTCWDGRFTVRRQLPVVPCDAVGLCQ